MAKKISNISGIHKVADAMEPALRKKFLEAVARIKNNANLTTIMNEIKKGNISGVMESLGLAAEFARFQAEALLSVSDLVQGGAAAAALPKGITINFDLTNPEVFAVIRNDVIDKVLKITAESEAAIRAAVERSFMSGIPTLQTAREIRDLVGLTRNQWATVGKYQEYLNSLAERIMSKEELSMTAEYWLKRGGMKGFGVIDKTGLTQERIDALIENYTQRLINERAQTIARTLTIDASNEGQQQLWNQAIASGQLDQAEWDVVWITTDDDRLCDDCLEMDGITRDLDGNFEEGPATGTDGPTLHPQCRCSLGLQLKDQSAGIFEQLKAEQEAA